MTKAKQDIPVEGLFESDPWEYMDREFFNRLKKLGFKKTRGVIPAYYHPKHWKAMPAFGSDKGKYGGCGDTWLDEYKFFALTPAAKKWLKESGV